MHDWRLEIIQYTLNVNMTTLTNSFVFISPLCDIRFSDDQIFKMYINFNQILQTVDILFHQTQQNNYYWLQVDPTINLMGAVRPKFKTHSSSHLKKK